MRQVSSQLMQDAPQAQPRTQQLPLVDRPPGHDSRHPAMPRRMRPRIRAARNCFMFGEREGSGVESSVPP